MAGILDSITNKVTKAIGLSGEMPTRKTSGFSIEEFRSKLNQVDGVLPTNLFLVTLFPKMTAGSFGSFMLTADGPRTLSFFTYKTDLPGIDIAVDENIPHGIGPLERFPHSAVYGDIELQFIGDGRGAVMNLFHRWLMSTVEFQSINGASSSDFFKVAYRDEYTCTMEIVVFNPTSDKILTYKLIDAFPYRLYQVPLDWSSQDYMRIGVQFFYKAWESDQFSATQGQSTGLSFVQKLIKAGTIVQTIASLKKPGGIADTINLVNNASIMASQMGGFFK